MFKPLLATDYDPAKLRFPVWASYKLDGIRAVVRGGVVYSRSNKPIPNVHVQAKFKHLEHHDGELIVGDPTDEACYRNTTSVVMAHDKPADDVTFHVFDHVEHPELPYLKRCLLIRKDSEHHTMLKQLGVPTLDELTKLEAKALELGYEGLIVRDPLAPYKYGRSTVNEGILLKVKSFHDAEAVVVGFEERMRNENEATINELGRTARSSHKAGKVGRGDLGALIVRRPDGLEFAIGTGFTDAERADIWTNRDAWMGRLVKYKFFPQGGYDAPRHPVYLGVRDERDV